MWSPIEVIFFLLLYVVLFVPSVLGYIDSKEPSKGDGKFKTRYTAIFDELHDSTKKLTPEELRDILTNKKP